jgi:glycosyltransferase involved in cell wall biosynthesis
VVSFLASKALFNLHAYDWFVDNVWKDLRGGNASLEVAGTLCLVTGRPRADRIIHLGIVERPANAYARCHVMVNPVQAGSGLKMKNVEAMAHGRPVITTSLGAEGLEGAIGRGLIIADNAEAFCDALLDLQQRPEDVSRLSQRAKNYVAEAFNPEACFGELEGALASLPVVS